MLANPYRILRELRIREQNRKHAFRYPVRVDAIYDWAKDRDFPAFKIVREFCNANHVIFVGREYDSHRFWEDRDKLVKLPAFHIYIEDYWHIVVYPDENPIQEIQTAILKVKEQETERLRKKEKWIAKKQEWIDAFWRPFQVKSLIPRRPALKP